MLKTKEPNYLFSFGLCTEYKSFKKVIQYYFKQIYVLNGPDKKLVQAFEAKRRVDVLEGKYLVIAK